ncbi:MAG: hypothetical protein E3J72_15025 [Planctomycetota bacterium]|nr:MAG: hypothetical protein E3J72_15025 [Planctomycetota bacterium]
MAYSFDPILKKWQKLVADFQKKAEKFGKRGKDFFRDSDKPPEDIRTFFDDGETALELLKEDVKNLFLLQFQLHEKLAEEIKNTKLSRLQADIADFEEVREKKRTLMREKEDLLKKQLSKMEEEHKKAKVEAERPLTAEVVEEKPPAEAELHEEFAKEDAAAPQPAPSQAAADEDKEVEISEALRKDIRVTRDKAMKEKPDLGLMGYLDYSNWFYVQTPDVQEDVMAVFCSDPRFKPKHMFFIKIDMLPPSMAGYLWKTANTLMKKKHDDIAVKLLIKGLTIVTDKVDKEMLHIIYAKYFYRQRKEIEGAYDGCINHCGKAIKSFLADKDKRDKPVAPFKLLTQIYEEQEKFDEIVKVCEKAIKLFSKTEPKRAKQFMKLKKVLEKKLKT